jgi:hypothetical protein
VGVRIDWQTRLLNSSADGFTVGARFDHLFSVAPGTPFDGTRWEGLVGYTSVPRGYRRWHGYDLLARVGFARGALGGGVATPAAFVAGATFGFPIRLFPSDFGADEGLRGTLMLVPFVDLGFLWAPELSRRLQLGGGLAVRIHLDSALLP